MKKRKLRGYVIPTLYFLIVTFITLGIVFLSQDYNFANKDYNYGTSILDERIKTVVVEDTAQSSMIKEPIEKEKANITTHYYSKNDDENKQQKSIIYYNNTYIPNTGVIYTSDDTFNINVIFNAKVTDISQNEFFGNVIEVTHNNNLKSIYYGVEDPQVQVGDEIDYDCLLGISTNNEIYNNKKSFMLEVYYNNKLLDPEKVFGTKITDYI